ncbi:hypothetical protein KC367_g6253 [Hortaea werneckii]|uniref:Ribosomal RNA-processing protein 14/surfeit locus protein 6 C-terminal domain-containing protein n=2 Tax=Hortaea werneckii TaxID=91943 RepID=A0A3M7IEV5_HORWE|nr:hypothetical protein KC350_g15373 [Hortaea werneckii]OTA39073.1 hypothetical protein BTJ68_00984 [Hortaea werneckii EXF-2000]KAI6807686.1 hypothetical protein KC358_g13274 [Hortaea werneckii]KAI6827564.1 hypothetical protein KC342_g9971 [Hortaea werneckii]KAI6909329.1 hypothetical protein KC348_g13534 [Hortaea werneckii]
MAETSDIPADLEERLQSHAKAFESLLALTPAREYYGSQIEDGLDPSEQWNRKKQTKEQKKAAKKAKLDPANQKSALDIMKERERKRKRELGEDEDDDEAGEGADDDGKEGGEKRQKVENEDAGEAKRRAKAEKRKEKRDAKKEKIVAKKSKAEAKKSAKQDQDLDEALTEKKMATQSKDNEEEDEETDGDDDDENAGTDADLSAFDASGLTDGPSLDLDGEGSDEEEDHDSASSAPSSPANDSPAFDVSANHSTASSSSSILPPTQAEKPSQSQKPQKQAAPKPTISLPNDPLTKRASPPSGTSSPKIQLPNIDQAELQERLRSRIEELRARRKADGPEGKPARSRQELLEQRRKKEEQRKEAKKEQRRKAKEEEQRKREEQLRAGSGSPMPGADMFSPRPQQQKHEDSFNFSRLAFEDGTQTNADFSGLQHAPHKKGPQDPRTALEAAQNKQRRVSGYDAEKRADIAEKDLWLNAKKRAHGERVRDDTSLLKKALKRKEKQKGKSEKAWKEREETVVKGKEMKQKKREDNLRKRREEKGGNKGGKKKAGAGKGTGKKKGGRPGFEGSLKA